MPAIRIEDVPDDVVATLEQQAAAQEQSLEEYLRVAFVGLAARYRLEDENGLSPEADA